MAMQTYTKKERCPKCGEMKWLDIWRKYRPYRAGSLCGHGPDEEHIERRCRNCAYEKYVRPKHVEATKP